MWDFQFFREFGRGAIFGSVWAPLEKILIFDQFVVRDMFCRFGIIFVIFEAYRIIRGLYCVIRGVSYHSRRIV